MQNISEIMLRRKSMIVSETLPQPTLDFDKSKSKDEVFSFLPEESKKLIFAATVAKNMESLGYIPDKEMFEKMIADKNFTAQVSQYVIPQLVEAKGADIEYHPMYPNFPKQVMEMNDAELYINAIIHYATFGQWQPEYAEEKRDELNESVKLKKLSLGTKKDCVGAFSSILNSVVPFSPQDKDDITVFMKAYDVQKAMPEFIVNRENMAVLANMVLDKKGKKAFEKLFTPQIKSVTDVLRIMNLRHGNGDATLAEKFKEIRGVNRSERRIYLSAIDKCRNAPEDMKINKSTWVKVGRALHPGEFKDMYPNAFDAFNKMREKELTKEVHTFNAVTENAMRNGDINELTKAMTEKPGVFARNLDRLLRDAENPGEILNLWNKLAPQVAPALLWQVHSHFDRRINEFDDPNKMRIFTTIGATTKTKVVEDTTKPIPVETCKNVKDITEKALKEIYKEKPPMGKVYIDPQIAKCKIPNDTRDASKGSTPLAKGSRLDLGENTNIARGFIWWTNLEKEDDWGDDRVDVDLSAIMLDKDLNRMSDVSYYNLRNSCAVHSGDIVNGGDFNGTGAAEFVDVDLNKAKKTGVKYVCFTVHAYSQQTFEQMDHIRFGFMEREKDMEGQIFEPSTVQQCVKLDSPSMSAITCMFDVDTKEMIWIDAVGQDCFRAANTPNNALANMQGSKMTCYKAIHMEKPDISDVIRINVEARNGEIVYTPEEADLVFGLNEGIRPTDLAYFSGELMPKEVSPEYLPEPEPEIEKEEIPENPIQEEIPEEVGEEI